MGPCRICANWYALQKGGYRVNGPWTGACHGTNGSGVYKAGFHEALSELKPGAWSKCFSLGGEVRFVCCSVFFGVYKCLFTWDKRSDEKKKKPQAFVFFKVFFSRVIVQVVNAKAPNVGTCTRYFVVPRPVYDIPRISHRYHKIGISKRAWTKRVNPRAPW